MGDLCPATENAHVPGLVLPPSGHGWVCTHQVCFSSLLLLFSLHLLLLHFHQVSRCCAPVPGRPSASSHCVQTSPQDFCSRGRRHPKRVPVLAFYRWQTSLSEARGFLSGTEAQTRSRSVDCLMTFMLVKFLRTQYPLMAAKRGACQVGSSSSIWALIIPICYWLHTDYISF